MAEIEIPTEDIFSIQRMIEILSNGQPVTEKTAQTYIALAYDLGRKRALKALDAALGDEDG